MEAAHVSQSAARCDVQLSDWLLEPNHFLEGRMEGRNKNRHKTFPFKLLIKN